MEKEQAEKLIKKVLPSFSITGVVGKGAFGAVYRIQDQLKERVAKIVPLHASTGVENGTVVSADTKLERDFRHIVESYERIACDEIVSVYDFYLEKSEDQGSAYALVIMEIYPANLQDYVISHYEKTGQPLDIALAQKLMEKVAVMLGNLYTKMGFLFEDFKPENLLVKDHLGDLKVVVGDIGGLKNVVSIALTGSQVTPNYCAPEVIRKAQVPNMLSIIYSYGLLCFFILEGHLPYEDKGISARFDMVQNEGIPFSRSDIPDNLKNLIQRCLSFEPEGRFRNFNDVVLALQGRLPAEQQGGVYNDETMVVGSGAGVSNGFNDATIAVGAQGAAPQPLTQQKSLPSRPFAGKVNPKRAAMARAARARAQASGKVPEVSLAKEKESIEKIEKEIDGFIVRKDNTYKISNESCRVKGNIIVDKGGTLVIEKSKLYFAKNSGIIVGGTLRANETLFSAIDFAERWNNITIFSLGGVTHLINNCKFHFGGGKNWKSLKEYFNLSRPLAQDNSSYGGGLFIVGGKEHNMSVKNCTFYKCSATEGGGIYWHMSEGLAEDCLFDTCSAMAAGGAVSAFEGRPVLKNSTIKSCTASKYGGGVCCINSKPTIEKSIFLSCISKFNGGGVSCIAASPTVSHCKFERCATKDTGGAIFADKKSKPAVNYTSFSNCKPDDTNFKLA